MTIKKQSDIVQEKRELLFLLREKFRRELKDPDTMLESDLDKEIAWHRTNNKFETSESILSTIFEIIQRVDCKLNKVTIN